MILEFKDGKRLKLDDVISISIDIESNGLNVFLEKRKEKPFSFMLDRIKNVIVEKDL